MNTSTIQATAQTILIVDDESHNRKLLETLLKPEGYHTCTAVNGEEALSLIKDHAPDLILLDIMMPGIDGYALAGMLKARAETSSIPIIMVTALTDRSSRMSGLKAGAEDFLTKPVDRAELSLRVRNLLRLKTLGDLQKQAQEEIRVINASLEERVQQRTTQLREANLELEAFSYSVSHDLRSPLTSIAGFSGMLAEEVTAGSAGEKSLYYLKRIRAGVQQMSDLIDSLLSLAQISRTIMRHEKVDLSAVVQAIMSTLVEHEPERVVELVVQPLLFAHGDRTLLRQVLANLLGNAWKFCGKKPKTRIIFGCESYAPNETVYFVKDNGAGFDMAYVDKLFSPFQRLHAEQEFKGSGVGLATAHRIVTRHGGKIWAESEPGQGSTFYFTVGTRAGT
jgi:signal transduction histidine kinase